LPGSNFSIRSHWSSLSIFLGIVLASQERPECTDFQ
jgi:hypothetical protein